MLMFIYVSSTCICTYYMKSCCVEIKINLENTFKSLSTKRSNNLIDKINKFAIITMT